MKKKSVAYGATWVSLLVLYKRYRYVIWRTFWPPINGGNSISNNLTPLEIAVSVAAFALDRKSAWMSMVFDRDFSKGDIPFGRSDNLLLLLAVACKGVLKFRPKCIGLNNAFTPSSATEKSSKKEIIRLIRKRNSAVRLRYERKKLIDIDLRTDLFYELIRERWKWEM